MRERRIGRVHDALGEQGDHLAIGQDVVEALGQPVADQPLCLGTQRVERERPGEQWVGGGLHRQDTDLGTVAVRDDHLVVAGERGERFDRPDHVATLRLGVGALPTA